MIAAYAVAVFAWTFAATALLSLIYAINHLDADVPAAPVHDARPAELKLAS